MNANKAIVEHWEPVACAHLIETGGNRCWLRREGPGERRRKLMFRELFIYALPFISAVNYVSDLINF